VTVVALNDNTGRSLPQTFDTVVDPLCHGANEEAQAGRRTAPVRRHGLRLAHANTSATGRTIAVLAAVIVIAAACGGTSTAKLTSSDRPTPTPTSASGHTDTAEIERAYVEFWDAVNAVAHQDPSQWPDTLGAVATDPELNAMLNNLKTLRSRSLTVYGTTREHVTKIDVTGVRAVLTDCQDASESGQADVNTGQHKTVGIPRNPITADLVRSADGRWRVSDVSYPGGGCT
jgi:hypothetical protein